MLYQKAVKHGLIVILIILDIPDNEEKKTVINNSADTVIQALNSFNSGRETTYTAPYTMTEKVDNIQGVRFVRCPAEENKKITCQNCGSGKPLCARAKKGLYY
jgi:hypothetical protein